MKKFQISVLLLCISWIGAGCVAPGSEDARAYNNFFGSMFSTMPGAIQRKQAIIDASLAERNNVIQSGGQWTSQDEQRRIWQLNQDLQRNANESGMDLINGMQNNQ